MTDDIAERTTVAVEVWSDVVCPWCYIGKRRFAAGVADARTTLAGEGIDLDVIVTYRAYQLDPTATPGAASPVIDGYAKKFGGPERARAIIDHVTATAADVGLEFRMDRALRANTLLAHRLIWFAGQPGSPVTQDAMKERLLAAYFTDGLDIGSPEVLVECAVAIGLDRDDTRSFLESTAGLDEVRAEIDAASDQGITAVPTYVFDGRWAIPGAQEPETFTQVLRKMAARAATDRT
jgi:predicted DsbA family dithiol-disulfide isomerase